MTESSPPENDRPEPPKDEKSPVVEALPERIHYGLAAADFAAVLTILLIENRDSALVVAAFIFSIVIPVHVGSALVSTPLFSIFGKGGRSYLFFLAAAYLLRSSDTL